MKPQAQRSARRNKFSICFDGASRLPTHVIAQKIGGHWLEVLFVIAALNSQIGASNSASVISDQALMSILLLRVRPFLERRARSQWWIIRTLFRIKHDGNMLLVIIFNTIIIAALLFIPFLSVIAVGTVLLNTTIVITCIAYVVLKYRNPKESWIFGQGWKGSIFVIMPTIASCAVVSYFTLFESEAVFGFKYFNLVSFIVVLGVGLFVNGVGHLSFSIHVCCSNKVTNQSNGEQTFFLPVMNITPAEQETNLKEVVHVSFPGVMPLSEHMIDALSMKRNIKEVLQMGRAQTLMRRKRVVDSSQNNQNERVTNGADPGTVRLQFVPVAEHHAQPDRNATRSILKSPLSSSSISSLKPLRTQSPTASLSSESHDLETHESQSEIELSFFESDKVHKLQKPLSTSSLASNMKTPKLPFSASSSSLEETRNPHKLPKSASSSSLQGDGNAPVPLNAVRSSSLEGKKTIDVSTQSSVTWLTSTELPFVPSPPSLDYAQGFLKILS